MKIAMWSGPRNLSTALMYAFASRTDCAAWDEPFYAAYLAATGIDHPMRAEVIAALEGMEHIAAARAERLSTIDADSAEQQARVEELERQYMERLERERAGALPGEAEATPPGDAEPIMTAPQ